MHFKMIHLCMYCQWIWLDTDMTVSHLFGWLRSDESEYLKSLAAFVLFDLWFVLHKRQHEIWCLHTWSIHLRSVSRSSFVVHASEMFVIEQITSIYSVIIDKARCPFFRLLITLLFQFRFIQHSLYYW